MSCPFCIEKITVKAPPITPPRLKFCVRQAKSNRHLPPSSRGNGSIVAVFDRVTENGDFRVTDDGSQRVYQ